MDPSAEGESAWPKKRHTSLKTTAKSKDNADTAADDNKTASNNATDDTTVSDTDDSAESNNVTATNSKTTDNEHKHEPSASSDETKRHCTCRGFDGFYVPRRYLVTFLMGLGMLLTYAMRTNVGLTVVMILDERAHEKLQYPDAKLNLPNVAWDSRMIGFLHSVFYIGYIVTQIPGAYFTTMWPSHKIFGLCILVSSILNLSLPVSIQHFGYSVTCVVRICQGMSEGLLYPACYGVLRHWSAPSERSRQVSGVLTCAYAGAIIGFPMAGLCTHYLGWQYIYYVSGGSCIAWFIVWVFLSYEKPSHHLSISDSEFEYLEKTQGQDVIDYENIETPWRQILTSLPLLAICLCHFARHWVFILMLTNEPLYLNEFGFNIALTGVYASIPHIAKVTIALASGVIADALLNHTQLSTTIVRKLLTGVGLIIQAVCFFILAALVDGAAVIVVLTIALGAFGLSTSGWQVNHYDLSTRHASVLVAVTSSFGTVGAIFVPLAVGHFTINQDLEGWTHVFYLTASIVAFAVIFFLIFGSGEQQQWATPPPHIELIQKTDPLAVKPYKIATVQGAKGDKNNSSNMLHEAMLIQAKTGHGYGTNGTTSLPDFNEKEYT